MACEKRVNSLDFPCFRVLQELVRQLEDLLEHPNPPRNYVDALAKVEFRKADNRDLTPIAYSNSYDLTSGRTILRQRPRLLRTPHSSVGISQPQNSVDTENEASKPDDNDYNRTGNYEIPPLPANVAANLGITSEQQERRKIWLTKIAGYRNFHDGMMSMDNLLGALDKEQAEETSNERPDDQASSERALGDLNDRDEHVLAEDRDFEELIKKSWRLYDEDFNDIFGEGERRPSTIETKTTDNSKHGSSSNANWPPTGKRLYHTSRVVHHSDIPKKPARKVPEKHSNVIPKIKNFSIRPNTVVKLIKPANRAKSKTPITKTDSIMSRLVSLKGIKIKKTPLKSLVRPASPPSKASIKRHVSESKLIGGETFVPLNASVSTGDMVELRLNTHGSSIINSNVRITVGGVIQKTSGRFHFNVILKDSTVIGAREPRLGFVARGAMFDEDLLRRSGISDDDIQSMVAYGKELREYEDTHGAELLASALEAAQLRKIQNQKAVTDREPEVVFGDIAGDIYSEELEVDIPDTSADIIKINGVEALKTEVKGIKGDAEEPAINVLIRVAPHVARIFNQKADELLLSHFRELKEYWHIAIRNGQKRVTADALARLIFEGKKYKDEPISDIARFAAYIHMINDPVHFIPDSNVFYTSMFELRDPASVQELQDAKEIVRENSPEFKGFIEKSRKLVLYSYYHAPSSPLRASLDPEQSAAAESANCKLTGWNFELSVFERNIPCERKPTKKEIHAISFNDTDKLLIKMLCSFVFGVDTSNGLFANPYQSIVSPIIKKIGVYGGADLVFVTRFLIDIGVWPYWFDPKPDTRAMQYDEFGKGNARSVLSAYSDVLAEKYIEDSSILTNAKSKKGKRSTNNMSEKESDTVNAPDLKELSKYIPEVRSSIVTKSKNSGTGVLSATEFYDRDICESIRHDFGNIPVYTIDNADTRDVDDGVSVETVKGADGKYQEWLHIHITDPTSLIHPGHVLAETAGLKTTSIYYPDMIDHMLPKNLVLEKLSLSRQKNGGPVNTMTFSARIGSNGDIEEYKVRPGIVRNIISAPYELVDQHISYLQSPKSINSLDKLRDLYRHSTLIHPFASKDASLKYYGEGCGVLTKKAISELQSIQRVIVCHANYRKQQGSFLAPLPDTDLQISDSANLMHPGSVISGPRYLHGKLHSLHYKELVYPRIQSTSFISMLTPAHMVVMELMVIAGRVAARFMGDRNADTNGHTKASANGVIIEDQAAPLIYRVQHSPDFDSLSGIPPGLPVPFGNMTSEEASSARAVWEAMLDVSSKNNGYIEPKHFDDMRHLMNPSIFDSIPGEHMLMGIRDKYGYARVTSPLRRADDLICHWQLKAQLLAENMDVKDQAPWYWKKDDIDYMLPSLFRNMLIANKYQTMANEFWQFTLLQRMEFLARRGKLELPPDGFYDINSPHYEDSPWSRYNPQNPGPLIWTATVDNRDETRDFISIRLWPTNVRAMLLPRPVDPSMLPFAGTKIRVLLFGIEPLKGIVLAKLAPEELQPPETPKFWRSQYVTNYIPAKAPGLTFPPEAPKKHTSKATQFVSV
ncbi:3'-5' RNA exonuclease complex component [Coemansia spiralis]|uniref:3'-5' RNA exonuclease complex component n=1 Tax=Coemansia spiralis TaxID=417178 RepID=A0A9W8G2H6_9FUNG|nr:3'-5' RNA exonuclease complex component [Coemansia sp. RSA 1358]KAJ2669032.1 3'-5' RNA exonuclease complex component [Coemansia spiralis]